MFGRPIAQDEVALPRTRSTMRRIRTARRSAHRVPQRRDLMPAGGGTCFPIVLKSCPMKPSGVQLARPIFPPRLQTRRSSPAARSWSGVNMTPKVETTTSKLSAAKGNASASASRNSIVRRSHRRVRVPGRATPARNRSRRRRTTGARRPGRHCHFRRPRRARLGRRGRRALRTAPRQRSAASYDDGIVAGGPSTLLARLHGGEVRLERGNRVVVETAPMIALRSCDGRWRRSDGLGAPA